MDSLWLKVWFAFAMYVVKAPWPFLVFAAALVFYGYVRNFRASRKLPTQAQEDPSGFLAVPVAKEVGFKAERKARDYDRFLIFLFPGFAIAGAISLAFALHTLRIGTFEWKRLSDLIVPGVFLLVGFQGTRSVFGDRFKTQRILNDPICVMGIVTATTDSGLQYRFRDVAGLEHEGQGTEYSGDYYEDMHVPVVYERGNATNNLPVSALYDEYEVKFKVV